MDCGELNNFLDLLNTFNRKYKNDTMDIPKFMKNKIIAALKENPLLSDSKTIFKTLEAFNNPFKQPVKSARNSLSRLPLPKSLSNNRMD